MKVNVRNFEQFLKGGEYDLDEDVVIDPDAIDDIEVNKVSPMRSLATRNKKEDATIYKNHDSKRYYKKR